MKHKIINTIRALLLISAIIPTFAGIFAYPQQAYAASEKTSALAGLSTSLQNGQICLPDNTAEGRIYNFGRCLNNIYLMTFVIAGFAGVLIFVWAGYLYMTGGEKNITEAKNKMKSVVLALGILLIIFPFLNTINPRLTDINGSLPDVTCTVGGDNTKTNVCNLPVSADVDIPGTGDDDGANTQGVYYNAAGVKYSMEINHPTRDAAQELKDAGCTFQSGIEQGARHLSPDFHAVVKMICSRVKADGLTAVISSTTGGVHSANSYHYRGCAVDFANQTGNSFMGSPTGQSILKAAQSLGFRRTGKALRINPGSDSKSTNHIHLDMGAQCVNGGPIR